MGPVLYSTERPADWRIIPSRNLGDPAVPTGRLEADLDRRFAIGQTGTVVGFAATTPDWEREGRTFAYAVEFITGGQRRLIPLDEWELLPARPADVVWTPAGEMHIAAYDGINLKVSPRVYLDDDWRAHHAGWFWTVDRGRGALSQGGAASLQEAQRLAATHAAYWAREGK